MPRATFWPTKPRRSASARIIARWRTAFADIARERVVIEHALDAGYPSAVAESMLHALEGALRIFEKHRELVLYQIEAPTVRVDPPPLKWSDLRYVFDIQEDCNGKEAIQA